MAGTKAGGIKAAKMNKLLYGNDFYSRIGHRGGVTRSYRRFRLKEGRQGWFDRLATCENSRSERRKRIAKNRYLERSWCDFRGISQEAGI